MTMDELKLKVAKEAFNYVENSIERDTIIGVGTGSTANFFIEELGKIASRLEGAVASSEETARRLKSIGIPVFDLNTVGEVQVYVDGADEANEYLHLIKGGGAALTREKIIAAASKEFICIADESKLVPILGKFPLPVEVIPMSRSFVGILGKSTLQFFSVFHRWCATYAYLRRLPVVSIASICMHELENGPIGCHPQQ